MSHNVSRRTAIASASVAVAGSLLSAGVARADEAQQLVSADVLDFLYIDNAEMYAGEEQNVVVSLNGVEGVTAATLVLANSDAGSETSVEMTNSSEGALLFTFAPAEAGTYSVSSLAYSDAAGTRMVDFTDTDSSYRSFIATYAVSTMSLSDGVGDDGPTLQVYASDGGDDVTISSSIEEGAAAAESSATSASARSRSVSTRSGNIVIALDPGHVGVSSGAVGVSRTQEADCTWKIAQYCKAELETYENVKVVYTVEQGGSLSYSNELQERVQSAVNQGADVLVSLHLNSTVGGSSGRAYGAEIYVPYDSNYNSQTHAVGEALAQRIISELNKLGLSNRGVKIRKIDGHDSDYDYPDGSIGDYYGIIRHARNANLPAIIIEHAFIDNVNDYNRFLSDNSKLQALGVADAQGIANYYGLSVPEGTMMRLYNASSGEHLYTRDMNEYRTLGRIGWVQEGPAWIAPTSSSTPVYRLYNPNSGDHHYTVSTNEYNTLGRIGWVREGLAWYSDDAQGVAIYRLFNPNESVGTHHYTQNTNEYETLGRIGWVKEGIAWYGVSSS